MAKKNHSLFSRKNSVKSKNRARKSRRSAARSNLGFESLENRQLLAVTTFQDGVGSYAGTEDTVLYSISPDSNFGSETSISPDQQDANGVRQGLLRFNDIIGSQTGQVPQGSTINSASLSVNVVNSSVAQFQMSLYRMLDNWSESISTWNSFGDIGGVQSSEGEATGLAPDGILFDPNTGRMSFDVTRSLKNWSAGQENLGWLIESTATDGWDWETSEAAVADRPILTVDFTAPSGAGSIEFIETELRQGEGDSGTTTAQVTVSRVGGVTGEVSATYTVAAGTAQAGDFVADTGTVTFASGETRKTIDVEINGDTDLEGNESLTVKLSDATGGASIGSNDVATITIADNDALINEVLANISPQDNSNILTDETNREFVELIGTPGASLDGYYFVIFEGQEEETADTTDETGSGVADLVVDLTGQTFGANGLLVLTPTNWEYTPAAGTNTLVVAALDAAAGGIEDDSQTYALIRSSVAITEGTDYDTIGSYDNSTRESTDTPLGSVGVLDVAPFTDGTAQIVDSVSVFNGGSDRDRAAVTPDLGLPGVHVHQPTGASNSGNVASDAVSRREGNTIPNTIGAWFNGDILDTRVVDEQGTNLEVIEYLNGTTRISVVAPDGSVLTPGAPNTLNNLFVSVGVANVDEAGGPTVTFTITRTGDTSLVTEVDFTTVDGTALAGSDYVAQSGTLTFGDGETTKEVVVQVNDDGVAEGFETFGIALNNADSPFLITDGTASVTINDADVLVATFQNGDSNGYFSTVDTTIDAEQPFDNFGIGPRILVDDAAGNPDFGGAEGADIRPQQGLLRFDNLFGTGTGQVPEGAQVFGGFLTLNVVNSSSSTAGVDVYRALQEWEDANSNWLDPQGSAGGSVANGFTPDGVEAAAEPDSTVPFPGIGGKVEVPVSQETLQGWANGTLDNNGWVFISDSDSSWEFSSAQQFNVDGINLRPELTILYTAPTSSGQFEFTLGEDTVREGDAATVTVQRVGGSTGTASVDYSVGFGTADASDVSGSTSGTLNFANGETSKTFTVQTSSDSTLEVDETLNLSLTGDLLPGGRSASVLKIRNDDVNLTNPPVLVNEIVYNQPGNDGGAELFELSGTPNAPLGGLYAVVIAGDVGPAQGATDLVVDLGEFTNGANGITLIGARDTFTWDVPDDTTFIGLEELNVEFLGGADNGTSTYALVYSPLTPLHTGRFDYDWDNDGSLELPLGATILDSIAIQDNSTEDSTYGPGSNSIQTNPTSSFDAVSRLPGNTSRNTASAWYGADLFGSNDALVYDAAESTGNIPSVGAAVTPGIANTGNDAANPIVTVTSIDTSSGVTINFDGTVEQVLIGDGTSFEGPGVGPGISVTNTDGTEISGVDAAIRRDNISGLGTSSLAISFTGSATLGGNLPAGTYNINFIGDSVVANGRALDAAGTGSPSNTSMQITVSTSTQDTDFDNDGDIDGADFLQWQRGFGTANATPSDGDSDGDGDVDEIDLSNWASDFGTGGATLAAVQQPAIADEPTPPAVPQFSYSFDSGLVSDDEESAIVEDAVEVTIDSAITTPADLSWTAAALEAELFGAEEDAEDEDAEFESLDEAFAALAAV